MDGKKIGFLFPVILWSIIAFLLLFRLEQVPKLWWDEGWTLSVARNWVENNHFGHYLENEPIPPRIPVRFPIVWPIVLSFKLIGIGIFQGRLPGVIFTFLTLIIYFYLSSQIYNKKVAYATIIILVFLSGGNFNPIMIGRQVLAEMPMLFYLFSGYLACYLSLNRSKYWVVLASLFWGISLLTKIQVPPFFIVSMLQMVLILLFLKQWSKLGILSITLTGTLFVASILLIVQNRFVPSLNSDKSLFELLINSITVVLEWPVRQKVIQNSIYFFPILVGYVHFIRRHVNLTPVFGRIEIIPNKQHEKSSHRVRFYLEEKETDSEAIKFGLWGLGVSWFAWYLFFGMFWHRYLFPAYFIGSMFTSAFLYEVTNKFDLPATVLNASSLFLRWKINRANILSLLGVLIIGVGISLSAVQIISVLKFEPTSLEPVVSYIENTIPDGAVIETFESELFFIAPHNYHFPTDLVSMQLVRRLTIDPNFVIDYDPLEFDPDYLIVGDYSTVWELYDNALSGEEFKLERQLGEYDLYRRSLKDE